MHDSELFCLEDMFSPDRRPIDFKTDAAKRVLVIDIA
jgi:hypothetical protein